MVSDSELKLTTLFSPLNVSNRLEVSRVVKEISFYEDKRVANYIGLDKKDDDFISYEVLTLDGELCAFATIQKKNFPAFCPRVLSRTFVFPKYRRRDSSPRHRLNWPTRVILPRQIETLRSVGAKAGLISIENPGKYNYCLSLCDMLNRSFESLGIEPNWEVLDDLYQTCPYDKKACWQNILLYRLEKSYKLELPNLQRQKWGGLQ